MADKSVSELTQATQVTATDLFVLEQNGEAKKLTGQTLENWLLQMAGGKGGIQKVEKVSTAGLVDTYRITFSDTSTFTYTVTNGAKGDTGEKTYLWIKYSSERPTSNADIYDTPDNWIGIYTGAASAAPTGYTQYTWFKIKGETGEQGTPAQLQSGVTTYQVSDSGTIVPSGTWSASVPAAAQGKFLWTRTVLTFNTGDPVTSYSVTRMGIDGAGSVISVNGISPDATGNVSISRFARATGDTPTMSLDQSVITNVPLATFTTNKNNVFSLDSDGIVMPFDGSILVFGSVYFDTPSSAKPENLGVYVYRNGVEISGQITYTTFVTACHAPPVIIDVNAGDIINLAARNNTADGSCVPNAKATGLSVVYL